MSTNLHRGSRDSGPMGHGNTQISMGAGILKGLDNIIDLSPHFMACPFLFEHGKLEKMEGRS